MDAEKTRLLAKASEAASKASDGDTPHLDGYTALDTPNLNDPDTGLSLVIFQKNGTSEYIVAFAGTQNWQDAAADIALGRPQWEPNSTEIMAYLDGLDASDISFTGRSLGGVLAQYAAYDYLATTQDPAEVSLGTYNGLGGMDGLEQMHPNDFDPALASMLDAAHFFTAVGDRQDVVARLGDGHFGGNAYEIQMSESDVSFVDIHTAWNYFNDLTAIPQSTTSPDYLHVTGAQKLAALFAFATDDGKFDNTEGFFRATGGAILSVDLASGNQIDQLVDALFPNVAFVDWGLVRDSLPLPIRLELAILGMGMLGASEAYQIGGYVTDWTTSQIEATIDVMEKAVKIGEYALDQAIETGSEAIDTARDIYIDSLNYAADRIKELVGLYNEATDYTSDKWADLQELVEDTTTWLDEQIHYVGSKISEAWDELGSWAKDFMVNGVLKKVNEISSVISNFFSVAQVTQPRRDPLTFDLDNDGLETIGINSSNPILFDHDGDGIKTATGWIKPDDGFLALDRNGNGTINDGTELFGDATPLFDAEENVIGKAEDGFAALAQEDTNGDGVVNAQDARWDNLRIWQDLNQDGISQAEELKTLEEAGIAAMNVTKTEHSQQLPTGNVLADLGSFIWTGGSTGSLGAVTAEMGDIDLIEDTFHSSFTDHIPLTEEAAQLPDMNGSGQVRALRETASLLPTLAALLGQYSATTTRAEQLALLDQLIIEWGKTSQLPVTGDGAYGGVPTSVAIAGEAVGSADYQAWMTKLQTLERFNGRPFGTPPAGAESVFINIFSERKSFLNQAWEFLRNSVYDGLLLETRLKPYMNAISLAYNGNDICLDFTGVGAAFQARYNTAPGEAVRDLLDLQRIAGSNLNGMGWDGYGQLRDWLAETTTTTDPTLQLTLISALADFGYPGLRTQGDGTSSSESVIGADTGAVLNGGGGNDLVLGGNGDDSLNGGAGNDVLYGGSGNDIYVFNSGDGVDTIIESHGDTGQDTLQFGSGIFAGDISITQDGDKLVFSHSNGRDKISIANWFKSLADGPHRLDTVNFADGSSFDLATLQLGTANADTLTGTTADDILIGNAGNDVLTGDSGNDWLDGGSGADQMAGGMGNDIYVVDNAGDIVIEAAEAGTDTVDSKISYTLVDDIENLRLVGTASINGTGNSLDNVIMGNDGDNTLNGLAGIDTLIGGAGNDLLDGGVGDDVMSGGTGNDSYVVDSLTDTVIEVAGQGTDTVITNLTYTLGDNLENLTLIGAENIDGTGNELNNIITGNSGANILTALAGNDTLNGGTGADTMLGGAGNDTYVVDDSGDIVSENSNEGVDLVQSTISYTLTDNVENLTLTGTANINATGNTLDNILTGNTGANMLNGLGGNDILDGKAGADVMIGGSGNDTYIVDNAGDVVMENADEGTDTVQSSINYTLGDNLEHLTLTGNSSINGTGNTLDNVIIGNIADNVLDGGLGVDAMAGGYGNDTYILDNPGDSVTEYSGQGTDTVISPFDYTLGANIENLTLTDTALNGTGNELNNVIIGTGADNTLIGLDGNDTLDGGQGADTLMGGRGNDTYVVDNLQDTATELTGEGVDTVQSNLTWTLANNLENLTLTGMDAIDGTGNELNNMMIGNSANNTLAGLAGNDTLDGGAGANTLLGGIGNDTYIVDNVGDLVIENANEGTDLVQSFISYTLTDNVENLTLAGNTAINGTGNELDNVMIGNSASNILTGLDGNDFLDGKAGADVMQGNAGNDTYIVDNTGDQVIEMVDEGIDLVQSGITYTLADNVENLTLTGTGSINATGNMLDNAITGNSGNNVLDGAAGVDTLAGGSGNDTYIVDNTADVVLEGLNAGTDTVLASATYTLSANVENLTLTGTNNVNATGNVLTNTITGNEGDNILSGLEGNDIIVGNGGNDWLDGGAGTDTMTGGMGNDTYVLDSIDDVVTELEGEGTDTIRSSISYTIGDTFENLTLIGTAAINGTGNVLANTITGNVGNNILSGLEGNDILVGNSGNDLLDGGIGADTMAGNAGDDMYVVDNAGDVVIENADEGVDTVQSSITYTLGDNVENLTLTGTAAINGTGNGLDNIIIGNTNNNVLSGLVGNDTLTGNTGNDLLDGGTGADMMIGNAGNDTFVVDDVGDIVTENLNEGTDLVQSSITYTLTNNVENLTLIGTADINGTGNALNNTITANSGLNTLVGLGGNDTYIVDNTSDVVVENVNEGTDIVQSSATYTLSANVENLTLTGTANINGTGNTLNNVITGNSGANILDGDGGADSMAGGAGNDTYIVDNAGDVVTEAASAGIDLVYSSVTYTLTANVENLTLTGTANINGTGNALNNIIIGNTGNNQLDGSTGADTMLGGIGNDTYVVDNAGDVVIENADEGTDLVQSSVSYTLSANVENLTLTGTAAINGTGNGLDNIIIGNTNNNVLSGLVGNDTLTGNTGNDMLDGGVGADMMIGNAGNDTFVVDDVGDLVTENANEGIDLVQSSITYTLTNNVENLTLTGTADINGTGNVLNNVITGNTGNNILDGGVGADTMYGGAGNDILIGGDGNDSLDGGLGADSMTGNTGNDTFVVDNVGDLVTENLNEGTDLVQSSITYTLTDNVENLTLTGTANINGTGNVLNNVITGNTGANTLYGLEGNDTLDGGTNADTMLGGIGNDTYVVDNTGDVVIENADEGTDLVQSSVSYTLSANVENLTLTGTAAINGTGNGLDNIIIGNTNNNVLSGLVGNDTLTGNAGNDLLDGGVGADMMIGNAGNDTFVVDDVGDLVTENLNEGTDLVQSAITYTLTNNVENLTLTGTIDINGTGNTLNNVITGNTGNNIEDGGVGADTIYGGAGNDILIGGDGNDSLDGGLGADMMTGNTGNDTFVVDNVGDLVTENANEGTDLVQSSITYTLTDNVENLTLTGTANINGTGNVLNNVITGNTGANTLYGLEGNDTLNGGAGADTMLGGIGNDTYVVDNTGDVVIENADEGVDTVQSSITYTLGDNVENLVLTGTAAINGTGNGLDNVIIGNTNNNVLSGLVGNDTLTGNTGNDMLDGGVGADMMIGNAGNDTFVVDDVGDLVTENANEGTDLVQSSITYTLTNNVENLTLTGTTDINGTGNTLNNVITGNSGNNILDGGVGADSMIGGAGDDTYYVDNTGDVVTENVNAGIDIVRSSITYTLTANVENLTLTGTAAINGTGNTLNNVLIGNSAANILNGGAGSDTLIGDGGNDTYIVDNLGDLVTENANEGTDTVQSSISYALGADVENLTLTGSAAINGTGNALNNVMIGNSAANVLDGGLGADTMIGGAGNDTYIVDNVGDIVTENANGGTDTVQSSISYSLSADVENLTLTGDAAINGTGNALNNVMIGNSAANIISGGAGNDALLGGSSSDVYVFNIGDGVDTIDDISTLAEGNMILFGEGITPADLTFVRNDGVLTINYGNNGDAINLLNFDQDEIAGSLVVRTLQFADGTQMNLSYFINRPPIVTNPIPDQTILEDAVFSFTVPANTFVDVDLGDILAYSATLADGTALPSWLTFDPATMTFSGTPANDNVGILPLKVTATDIVGASVSDEFNMTVENVNDAPVVANPINDQTILEDAVFNFIIPANTFADPDLGDILAYSATLSDGTALPSWLTFDPATMIFSGTPTNDNVGILPLKVTATDTAGATVASDFNVTVINVNDAPVVANPITDQTTMEDAVFNFTIPANTFVDVDLGDTLTYSATLADGTALPSWLTFDPATMTFSGTPTNDNVGILPLKVTATDIVGASVSDEFNVTVSNVNDAPVVANPIVDQNTMEDAVFSFTVPANTFADVDLGDTLTYSATLADGTALPAWLTFDPATMIFSGTPANDNVGILPLKVTAIDTAGASVSDEFNVTVSNVNDAPVVANPITDQSTMEDAVFSFTVPANTFADVDLGDTLTYSATLADGTALPSWLTFDPETMIFSGIPVGIGTNSIKVTATDNAGASVSASFNLEVQINVIIGTENDDHLIGTTHQNIIYGLGGNDTIDGREDADTMIGGAGDDTYIVDNVGDVVTENANEGTDTVQSSVSYTLGADIENLTLTGIAAINGTGNDLDNVIIGNDAGDVLTGGKGNDTIYSGAGNDSYSYHIGDGLDRISDVSGSDTLVMGSGITYNQISLRMDGAIGRLRLLDAGGNETSEGMDIVLNPDGSIPLETIRFADGSSYNMSDLIKSIYGTNGMDLIITGGGKDLIHALGGVDFVYSGQGDDTIYGGDGIDLLCGDGGNDVIYGEKDSDALFGCSGNDTLDGGSGADVMLGGTGDDTYIVDNGGDVVIEFGNEGTDTIRSSVTYTLVDNTENLVLTGTLAINGTGNELDNVITGNSATNILDGGRGADTMIGGAGDDTYIVDNTGDIVTENANEGIDTVNSSITYTLGSNVENLTLTGTSAINGTGNALDNVLIGNSGKNKLTGGAGNDTLNGGTGVDTMIGGTGDDTYYVDSNGDVVTENANEGIDTVQSSITYTLGGNIENLTLTGTSAINGTGNALDNVLMGNSGNNKLTGGAGNDTLDGGAGNDSLIGGTGNDIYAFMQGYGHDTITDYDTTPGNSDTIKFGTGINPLDLILVNNRKNLDIQINDSADLLRVQNQNSGKANQVEVFEAGDGSTLVSSQVDLLIQAMAGFSAQNGGMSWQDLIQNKPAEVQQILAQYWQPPK